VKFLLLIASNLKRHPLRTLLTILTIFIAFLLFGFLSAIAKAFDTGVTLAGQKRLIIRDKVSIIQLVPISYQSRIARVPGVEAVTHQTWFGGYWKEPRYFFPKMPVVPAEFCDVFPEFVLSEEAKQKWMTTRTGAIIGEKLTREPYNFKVGDRVPIIPDIWHRRDGTPQWEFEIVGIYTGADKNTDTTQMFFRYDYFDEARAEGVQGMIGWYTVRISDPDRAAEVAKAIDLEFANSPNETKSEAESAFVAGFAQQIGDIGAIAVAILSAVFFTILLVAGNTMAQTVSERTEEIGVLKALGFSNGLVLVLVLAESCLIAGVGGVLGLGLAYGLISTGFPAISVLPVFYLPAERLIVGAVLILALGLVTGVIPAVQAMRLRIAVALRRN
jgi:putative ABC transport system permease protein